jgi:hypothetical protein
VSLVWTRYQPLTFDVVVPYFLSDAVERLRHDFGYSGKVLLFAGLPLSRIQDVVDQTRAAGVRGHVSFSLALPIEGAERHDATERMTTSGARRLREDANPSESLMVGSLSTLGGVHDQLEALHIGGIFGISTFDDEHQGFA